MPKETFKNLPEEKKYFIIQVATDEFYDYGYEKSSISRIVERSGIAKGSFYQYFEGKEDLFRLIIAIASEKKLEYLNNMIANLNNMSFFESIRTLFMDSLTFHKDNPKFAGIIDRFLKTSNSKLKEAIIGDEIKKSNLFLENLLIQYLPQNQLRSDLNVTFTAHLITGIALSLSDYIRDSFDDIEHLNITLFENLVDESVKFLKEGIEKKSQIH
jgi:AcrR family transcriptional regulator